MILRYRNKRINFGYVQFDVIRILNLIDQLGQKDFFPLIGQ